MMRIIRVFPRRTSYTPKDDMAFVGDPPLERPEADEVHISCVFTWDKKESERLKLAWGQYYPIVKTGGPAYDDQCLNDFVPGMYVRKGIVHTSYGCNNKCPWCLVHLREGNLRLLPINEGYIEQSNNLFQCPDAHIDKTLDMLSAQRQVILAGGVESDRINEHWADRIRSLRLKAVFFACDTNDSIKPLRKALKMLQLPIDKVRCYALLKYNPEETKIRALIRLLEIYEAGAIPFAQLYQPPEKKIIYPPEWTRFARTFMRPAGTKTFIKNILDVNHKGKY